LHGQQRKRVEAFLRDLGIDRSAKPVIFIGITHEPDGSPRRMKIVLVVVLVVGRF
jgi:hypothetical protein